MSRSDSYDAQQIRLRTMAVSCHFSAPSSDSSPMECPEGGESVDARDSTCLYPGEARRTGQEDLSARRFFRAQTSSRSAPRLFRKKYAEAPITIEKNATTAASIANAPKSTRAPGTAAN